MTQLIKTSSLKGFYELVNQLNGDADALLCRFNIEPDKVKKLEGVLPFHTAVNLVEETARHLNCPDFGLRLAQQQDLMVLESLVLDAPTIGEALEALSHNLCDCTNGFKISLDRDDKTGHGYLSFETIHGRPLPPQSVELIMGFTCRALRILSDNLLAPVAVWRTCDAPLHNSYRDFFRAPVIFSRPRDALALSAEHLETNVGQNRLQEQNQSDHTAVARRTNPTKLKLQVEQLIHSLLPTQRCGLQEVANRLGVHKRTLQRRLAEQSIVFEELVDDIRRVQANNYLAEPEMPMVQIAAELGYREQSSFNRACRRWFGTTPLKRRQQLLNKKDTDASTQPEVNSD